MKAEGGDATFSDLPAFAQGIYQNGGFNATMPLPAELTVGFSYQITDKWLAAVDWNYTYWNAYDNLTIGFENPAIPTSVNARNYKNSSTYRLGVQYQPNEKFSARIGGYFDESPVQEGYFAPETPRNDAFAGTLGFSYNITSKLAVDFSATILKFKEVDASYDHYVEIDVVNVVLEVGIKCLFRNILVEHLRYVGGGVFTQPSYGNDINDLSGLIINVIEFIDTRIVILMQVTS